MTDDLLKKQIRKLEDRIVKSKKAYYSGYPEISDIEYDALEFNLNKLDPNSLVLQLVGWSEDFKKILKEHRKNSNIN